MVVAKTLAKHRMTDSQQAWLDKALTALKKAPMVVGEVSFFNEKTRRQLRERAVAAGLTVLESHPKPEDLKYPLNMVLVAFRTEDQKKFAPHALDDSDLDNFVNEVEDACRKCPRGLRFNMAVDSNNIATMHATVARLRDMFGDRFMSSHVPDIPKSPAVDTKPQEWLFSIGGVDESAQPPRTSK